MHTPHPPSRQLRTVTDSPRLWPLPTDGELGWWPYVNLIYLFFVFLPILFDPRIGRWDVAASVLASLLFLPLYFAGYRAGSPLRSVVLAAAIAALGFALIPFNAGGNTFLIYAIALVSHMMSARATVTTLLAVLALMAAEIAWFNQPWPFLAITAVIGAMVAIGSLYGRAYSRRNAELKLSQEEVRRLARTAERERIGRDLHDLLGHTLSLIALKSELALKLFDRDSAAARIEMAEVERITRDALAQVRRAVSGIRAAALETELAQARLSLLTAGVSLDYRLDAPDLLPETETVLALAVREAITNVVRHARASRVDIELSADGAWIRLLISDDGRGAELRPGNGLRGMRERIEHLGGQLETACAPGEGMRLSIRVPRAAEAGAQATARAELAVADSSGTGDAD